MALALIVTTGAHWAALQTVAWTTMLAANLTAESFSEAVSDTFDGHHPCPLCKVVAAGKKSEQKTEFAFPMQKLEFPPVAKTIQPVAPTQFKMLVALNFFAEPRVFEPPTPPPRFRFC